MGELSPNDSLYPAALFAAGLVAETRDSATAYFRRLSIEHSRSDWADESLLRMSELAYAGGELSAAARFSERILLDYPFSNKLARAAYWAGRSRLELGDAERGCAHLRRAGEAAGNDVELSNRADYYLQRCSDSAGRDSTRAARPTQSGSTVYSVQVAAVQSAAAADEMMQSLSRRGFEPHVVRDTDGLLKIRVGRFSNRADAQQLLGQLQRVVSGQPFVVEERR
jgi:TolA-binding protein